MTISEIDGTDMAATAAVPLPPQRPMRRPRLRYLVLAILMLIGLLQLFIYTANHSNTVLERQATLMARVLTNQAALAARRTLDSNDRQAAQALVDNLASDPFIVDATLYDSQGVALAVSADAKSLKELLGFGGVSKLFGEQRVTPYIGVIHADQDGEMLGYMRVTLSHQALLDTMAVPRTEGFDFARVLLLLSGAMGFCLALAVVRR